MAFGHSFKLCKGKAIGCSSLGQGKDQETWEKKVWKKRYAENMDFKKFLHEMYMYVQVGLHAQKRPEKQ